MHSILVKDYMDNNPHAIKHSESVRDVVKYLLKEKLSGAPVIDDDKNLMGFVSEQDCLTEVLNDAFYCEETPNVKTVMTSNTVTTTPETSIVELAQQMAKSTPRNYPVVKNGKLIGLISRNSILNAIIEYNEDCYLQH